jgi:hypothetical protein
MMREITEKVRPPRALEVPYPLGYPFGEPGAAETQHVVLRRMLQLLAHTDVPVLEQLGA